MADIKIFMPILLTQEGGWCNKPGDKGGETWEGVAYNYYPKWAGWPLVFQIKMQLGFPATGWTNQQVHDLNAALRINDALDALVDKFYECSEWDTMNADFINNQSIANFLVDWEVNCGEGAPIKHTQIILGISPVVINMGPKTLAGINRNSNQDFFDKIQAARVQYYHDVVTANPSDQQFLSNWLKRTASFKFSNS
jgi:lysozyme family protein